MSDEMKDAVQTAEEAPAPAPGPPRPVPEQRHPDSRGRGTMHDEPRRDSSTYKFEVIEQPGAEAGSPARSIEGWVILVTGIHQEATEDDLRDKLGDYGMPRNLHLNIDRRTGFSKGYALVEFGEKHEAEAAIQSLNGSLFMGKPIYVDWVFQIGPTVSDGDQQQKQRRDRSQSPSRRHQHH